MSRLHTVSKTQTCPPGSKLRASHLSCDQQVCKSIVSLGWTMPMYMGRDHEATSFIGMT